MSEGQSWTSGAKAEERPEGQQWTLGAVLRSSAEVFARRGLDSPRLDAEVLIAHAMGVRRVELYVRHDMPLSDEERAAIRGLVLRRAKERIPVAYLTGSREFYGLTFEVGPGVLIPRPETESLVERVLQELERSHAAGATELRVCDVGTGSGAIAVAIAHRAPYAHVVAVDVSRDALATAARNCAKHEVTERVELVESDVLDALAGGERFHIIVSNPPYIPVAEREGLQPEVARWEPAEALFCGDDGLGVARRLLAQAPDLMHNQGLVALELGSESQIDAVLTMLRRSPRFDAAEPLCDFSGAARGCVARAAVEGR